MSNVNLYRYYLALDRITQRLQAVGVEPTRYALPGPAETHGETFWRGYVEREINDGEVPNLYKFGAVQVYIDNFTDYTISDRDTRDRQAQERREKLVRDLVAEHDDVIVARYQDGQTYLWMDYGDYGVTVNVGQALCERVLVGEDVTEVPDPELAEKALADIPLVKKVTPRYEWRCNDAELAGAGS